MFDDGGYWEQVKQGILRAELRQLTFNPSHPIILYILSYRPAQDNYVQDPFGKLIVRAKGSVIVAEGQIFAVAEGE